MELKEFINNTLTQIAEGVQNAIDASEGGGYLVNPSATKIGADCKIHFELSVESGKKCYDSDEEVVSGAKGCHA